MKTFEGSIQFKIEKIDNGYVVHSNIGHIKMIDSIIVEDSPTQFSSWFSKTYQIALEELLENVKSLIEWRLSRTSTLSLFNESTSKI